ncbi:ATP-binding protein [Dickeya dadantii]|uniref:AAA family ATPase n=1 Tax=Dickeya dadantii TaxID=204038 RepID=UPI00149555C1|nr:ATP-binding protein [Dickeya dadantii]NPE59151.1 ATP-binding protein [Dickeya dadantii]NPE69466.1 ATP-binding protein [Dickeya dadantii]
MIHELSLANVGPASAMHLTFGNRLNLLTGDNGLGKSFLLDIVWWALTRRWPAEVNPKLTAGKKALPAPGGKVEDLSNASIAFSFAGKVKTERYESHYARREQSWTGRAGRPANPGLVLYAMADGSFAVWDPHRNYWNTQEGIDVQERVPAYVLSPTEVWDGLPGDERSWLCNGLIRDIASWQKERGAAFKHFNAVLKVLSPSTTEILSLGELTRISLDDVREIPTLKMPYQKDVPILHASSGMRRILALAYFLVWAWEEHQQAAKLLGEAVTPQITFLIDEVESHLHPSWQRSIVPALLKVVGKLNTKAQVQLITTTHSPLVMTSVEPLFDDTRDAWFDLDFSDGVVALEQRQFEKHGDVNNWLTSEAFDLKSGRPLEYERLVEDAAKLLNKPDASEKELDAMYQQLLAALDVKDEFLFRWRFIRGKKANPEQNNKKIKKGRKDDSGGVTGGA